MDDGVDLTAALRAAEKAVEGELGYKIALTEKPLYDHAAAAVWQAIADAGDDVMEDAVENEAEDGGG